MEKLTAKQRKGIYIAVADKIESRDDKYCFMCNLISEIGHVPKGEPMMDMFPEFNLMRDKPLNQPLWFYDSDYRDENVHTLNEERITIMLLCAEMCEP